MTSGQGEGSQSTSSAASGVIAGVSVVVGSNTHGGETTSTSATIGATPGATTPASTSGNGLNPNAFNGLGSGVVFGSGSNSGSSASGSSASAGGGDSSSGGGSSPGSVATVLGVVGGVIGLIVLFLALVALLLFRSRRNRRVNAFLARFSFLKPSPYSRMDKRSSMGADLLFTDGHHGDALMNEKRSTLYGTTTIIATQPDSNPLTHPNPTAARPERVLDSPPPLIPGLPSKRFSTPRNPFEDPPESFAGLPQSPPPTVAPRRASQESIGGASIASSGIFSPSLLSWPMPPSSSAGSGKSSPPSTSHGPGGNKNNLAELAAKYQPLTPTKSWTPATPSNWIKPGGWD